MNRQHLWMALAALSLAAPGARAQSNPANPAPAASANISFHGQRFIVYDEGPPQGAAPDVLLIPGLGMSHEVWKEEVAKLAPKYRLHLVQIRGFAGYPPGANASGPLLEPIVTELAQYIEGAKMHPAVIGHSLGGTLALMLADTHPQDVAKLMLVDTLPFTGMLIDAKGDVDQIKPMAEQMRTSIRDEPAPNFLHEENAIIAGDVKTPEKRRQIVFWAVNSDRHTLTNAMYEDLTTDLRPDLAKMQTPTTLLYAYDAGAQSQIEIDNTFHQAYAKMPHIQLVRVDNSAHFIMLDQPQKFDELVQQFLAH